jgi:ribosomal protein L7/L12
MKLDKLKFARLVAHCVSNGMSAGEYEVNTLDEICDIDVPAPYEQVQHNYPSASDVNALMALMAEGKSKIEAIKMHRKLTGYGLKESKDEVEKHWPTEIKRTKQELYKKLNDAGFDHEMDNKFATFINSCY